MLIGVSGLAGSGKTTFSKLLADELQLEMYALASPVKSIVKTLFGWHGMDTDGVMKEVAMYTIAQPISTLSAEILSEIIKLSFCVDDQEMDVEELIENFFVVFKPYEVVTGIEGVVQYFISPRKAYQLLGTEWGRVCWRSDIWIQASRKHNVVWHDLRFEDEALFLKQQGGVIVRIESNRQTTKESTHVSEAGFDLNLVDITIDNSGTMDELEEVVKTVAEILRLTYDRE